MFSKKFYKKKKPNLFTVYWKQAGFIQSNYVVKLKKNNTLQINAHFIIKQKNTWYYENSCKPASLQRNIKPRSVEISRDVLNYIMSKKYVTRMFHERTAKQLMDAFPSGKRPWSDPELAGGIMLKIWPGCILEFHRRNCH